MIYSILPAFFISVLKTGAASLGLIEGIAQGVADILKAFSGRISDRLNTRKNIAVFGYCLSVITRPFYTIIGSISGIFGLRVTDRVGKGIREAPRDALISFSSDHEDYGKSFGFHRAADTLGSIIGPVVAFIILSFIPIPAGFAVIFWTAFILGVIAVFFFVFVKEIRIDGIFRVLKLGFWKELPPNFKILILSVLILYSGTLPLVILGFAAQDFSYPIKFIPLFFVFHNIFYALFSYPAGFLADGFGRQIVFIIGYLILFLNYLLFFLFKPFLLLLFVLQGLFAAFTDGVLAAAVSGIVKEETRATALGLTSMTQGFGVIIAGIVGGYLWQFLGYKAAFLYGLTLIFSGILIFKWAFERK